MRGMLIRGSLLFAATVAFVVIATHARAESPTIYKWVDENGIAHYTTDRDNIPSAIRDRVESRSAATPAKTPDVAAQPHSEDVMRDAVRTAPVEAAGGEPITAPAEPAQDVAAIAAPSAASATETESAVEAIEPASDIAETPEPDAEPEAEAALEDETTTIAAPTPLSEDVRDETSAVSSPPPAPVIPLDPEQQAVVAELDEQIEVVQGEIAKREDTLAALISTADEERTTPLVDDPAFREISQRLPKLQADLQTLRERRNKIQPTAPTP
jgi:hypothetical protein